MFTKSSLEPILLLALFGIAARCYGNMVRCAGRVSARDVLDGTVSQDFLRWQEVASDFGVGAQVLKGPVYRYIMINWIECLLRSRSNS